MKQDLLALRDIEQVETVHDTNPFNDVVIDLCATKEDINKQRVSKPCLLSQRLTRISDLDVLHRIEDIVLNILDALDKIQMPIIDSFETPNEPENTNVVDGMTIFRQTKRFTLNHCRSFTSVLLVASFCHSLILAKRTTTSREVYYFYVTHFRSQKECDQAIWDLCSLLQVQRHMLHLMASPKGWFCGDIQLYTQPCEEESPANADAFPEKEYSCSDYKLSDSSSENSTINSNSLQLILDGRCLPSIHGSPISSEWLLPPSQRPFIVRTCAATCILVVEKEGVYNNLSEEGFFRSHPCIIITGKGFPDLATRAMVHALHRELNIPVRGLADCNPFGVLVLNTYQFSSSQHRRGGVDGGDRYGVPMEWIGLRPSQVKRLSSNKNSNGSVNVFSTSFPSLPKEVFQELTELDRKRLHGTLLRESDHHRWTRYGQDEKRTEELQQMKNYKVEIEALNWLGMDFCSKWLHHIFKLNTISFDDSKIKTEEEDEWLRII